MQNNVRIVTYTENERDIVKQGNEAIRNTLINGTDEAKASLLFYLDYYIDIYIKDDLSSKNSIIILLQEVFFQEYDSIIQKDILDLIERYCTERLYVFENNINNLNNSIFENCLNRVLYLIDKMKAINTDLNSVKKLLSSDTNWITQTNVLQTFFNFIDDDEFINIPYRKEMKIYLYELLSKDTHPEVKECIEELLPFFN